MSTTTEEKYYIHDFAIEYFEKLLKYGEVTCDESVYDNGFVFDMQPSMTEHGDICLRVLVYRQSYVEAYERGEINEPYSALVSFHLYHRPNFKGE